MSPKRAAGGDIPRALGCPDLALAIGRLCGGQTWRYTGASALLLDETRLVLAITKPEHWRRADGAPAAGQAGGWAEAKGQRLLAGVDAIGGSLEGGEGVLACLRREVQEEIGAPVILHSADETHLVYEERIIETLVLPPSAFPAPALCTVSRNLYRREALPEARVLAIVTFWATLAGPPRLGDLFGLLAAPMEHLGEVLAEPPPTVASARGLPGARLEARQPMAGDTLLAPVWTARSLQILLRAGRLRFPSR